MVLRVMFVSIAALSLVACGQVEGGAMPDATAIAAPPATWTAAPPDSTPDPSAAAGDGVILQPSITPTPAAQQTIPAATVTSEISPMPTDTPTTGQGESSPAGVARAQAALAAALKVAPETLTLVQVEEQEWSDSSLGCASADQAYMQVITPGQLITFTDGSATYAVHTDSRGNRMVWCDAGKPVPLQSTSTG